MFDKPLKLTSTQIDFYNQNGYLAVENVFSKEECEFAVSMFTRHAKRINDNDYGAVMNLDRPELWTHIYSPSEGFIHAYVKQMLLKHPAIVTALETLQGTQPGGVVILQSMFLFKKVGTTYAGQAWNPHQDGAYHGSPQGGTLTANIAFVDQDKENGCMFIYPGSHKEGFLEAEKKASYRENPGSRPGHDVSKNLPEKYRNQEVEIHLKMGSILFLHGSVIHGSYPNLSKNRDRPMLLAPYKTEGLSFSAGETGKRKEIPIR
jgi:ectoine hydroxylase-related dioxygenase (phytanoyl-CoA dioxygenase family)